MKQLLLLLAVTAICFIARAGNLVVEENGLPPSYGTIQSAINAANAGDRIFIKNKAGNLPWLENITISQSVDLLAFTDDSFFVMQGSVTVEPTSSSVIDIIGMINLGGGISTNTNPTGNQSILRILNGQMTGGISVSNNNYYLIAQGTTTSSISYRHGTIVGNTSGEITVSTEGLNTADTNYIFGNIINANIGISWSSSSSIFDIRNNFITSSGLSSYGIQVNSTVSGNTAWNKMYNNTVSVQGSSNNEYGIYISGSANSQIDVQNNVVSAVNTESNYYGYQDFGIYANAGNGGSLTLTYNFIDQKFNYPVYGSITVDLNNNSSNNIPLNGNGSTQNNLGANAGNPGNMFYNTNLTVNNVGCYGGSYTLTNFFPNSPNWAMTWLTNYNFSVRTGNTLNIKASSYDK